MQGLDPLYFQWFSSEFRIELRRFEGRMAVGDESCFTGVANPGGFKRVNDSSSMDSNVEGSNSFLFKRCSSSVWSEEIDLSSSCLSDR